MKSGDASKVLIVTVNPIHQIIKQCHYSVTFLLKGKFPARSFGGPKGLHRGSIKVKDNVPQRRCTKTFSRLRSHVAMAWRILTIIRWRQSGHAQKRRCVWVGISLHFAVVIFVFVVGVTHYGTPKAAKVKILIEPTNSKIRKSIKTSSINPSIVMNG